MTRILMIWELGGGYGHVLPLLSLALPLRSAGHEIIFAVREPVTTASLLPTDMSYLQAPANFSPKPARETLCSYPQILAHTCFDDWRALLARAQAWRHLYAVVRPDVMVFDHSPTALLAARGLNMKCIVTGSGFVVPPDVYPLPNMCDWLAVDSPALQREENRVLALANMALGKLRAPALERLGRLFATDAQALLTFHELDNYHKRDGADYWGVPQTRVGVVPLWPSGGDKRIFVYLKLSKSLSALLEKLRDSGHQVLLHIPRLPIETRNRFANSNLYFSEQAVDMHQAAAECDLAIIPGGHGSIAALLLAGKPMLMLPPYLEMTLNARAVERLGAGLAADPSNPDDVASKLNRLLTDGSFSLKARAFPEHYRDFKPQQVGLRFVSLVDTLLA